MAFQQQTTAPTPTLVALRKEIQASANPKKAKILAGFFKTGKGEYGEGDVFVGITVPTARGIARRYSALSLSEINKTLASKLHEERLIGLLILVELYNRGDAEAQLKIFRFYLANMKRANNWDLVDLSAHKIVGRHLLETGATIARLKTFARSHNLWIRRVAIVATFAFLRAGKFSPTFRVAELLLRDKQDLIHKATGWMLREVGKRNKSVLTSWLKPRYRKMPRTMLRYAIERFPKSERKRYLAGKI